MLNNFIKTPSDCMWKLDEAGIDFEEVDEFEFFAMSCNMFSIEETRILFGDIDFQNLQLGQNSINGELVLYNDSGLIIDRAIYMIITDFIRQMHHIEKNTIHCATAMTKRVLIEEQRDEYEKNKDKEYEAMLPPLVIALTNCSEFKYSYYNIWQLPIYIFMSSAVRTQKELQYNHLMTGVYSGNVDTTKISKSELRWI